MKNIFWKEKFPREEKKFSKFLFKEKKEKAHKKASVN